MLSFKIDEYIYGQTFIMYALYVHVYMHLHVRSYTQRRIYCYSVHVRRMGYRYSFYLDGHMKSRWKWKAEHEVTRK